MKSIKLLTFGNSYSVDSHAWLYQIFKSAGYDEIILGHLLHGGCNINNHWSNVDEDTENDYDGAYALNENGNTSFYKKEDMPLRDVYIKAISDYPWDYVIIQHGPNHIEQRDTYSHLRDLLDFTKEHLQSKETKFLYHMVWKYNDNIKNKGTAQFYDDIIDITNNIVMKNEEFVGIIPAATMRQNIVSSYLTDKDVARDYGHMSLGFGRYALGLLWYCYITGGSFSDVAFIPTRADVRPDLLEQYEFDEVTEEKLEIAKEAILAAFATPFAVTPSKFTTEAKCENSDGTDLDKLFATSGGEKVE